MQQIDLVSIGRETGFRHAGTEACRDTLCYATVDADYSSIIAQSFERRLRHEAACIVCAGQSLLKATDGYQIFRLKQCQQIWSTIMQMSMVLLLLSCHNVYSAGL